ncbi:MAG: hypothetical protein PHG83_00785 [Patescibacteria group bacterium]|nr:hypothetical protein [Patescibacteria group bacterium]
MKKFNKNIKFITYLASIGSTLFLLVQKAMAATELNPDLSNFRQATQYAYGPDIGARNAGDIWWALWKGIFLPIIFIIGIIFLIKRWRRNKKKLNAQKNSQNGKI